MEESIGPPPPPPNTSPPFRHWGGGGGGGAWPCQRIVRLEAEINAHSEHSRNIFILNIRYICVLHSILYTPADHVV